MSWEDIIKVSNLERELAEEYAPEEMSKFKNTLGKLNQLSKELNRIVKKVITEENNLQAIQEFEEFAGPMGSEENDKRLTKMKELALEYQKQILALEEKLKRGG